MATGGISKRPSLFSDDGQLILSPAGNDIRIFSRLTGECTGILVGHGGEVTCIHLDPSNTAQVYAASKDGIMRLWNYMTAKFVRKILIRETIKSMVMQKELNVAVFSIDYKDGKSGRVITYDLAKNKPGKTALKTSVPRDLITSGPSGQYVATMDKHSLFVWRAGHEISQPLNLHHTKPYMCAAINSNETIIAAGDATGRILIWNGFGAHVPSGKEGSHNAKHQPAIPPSVTTYHWHASAVGALTFSLDSTYLLSGGAEGVLVMWMLASGKQRFLPRLGSALVGLSPSPGDPAQYLIRQAGNIIRIVNTATMKVDTSILGLRPCPSSLPHTKMHAATSLHPATGFLIAPCDNAQLQVYDTVLHRHVAVLQVSSRNAVSPTNRPDEWGPYGPPIEPHVSHTAFSPPDASVLVTVDVRPDGGAYATAESCLKFWDTASVTNPQLDSAISQGSGTGSMPSLLLNTRVDDPHKGGITSVAYHPTLHMVVTTGKDADFKIWTRAKIGARPGGGPSLKAWCWRCRSTGSYKGLPLSASAFSHDGSVLAIAALSRVSLWDPESNALSMVLTPPPEKQHVEIRRLAFVRNTPYLVAISSHCVMVWNLLTATLHWSLDVPTCDVAADPVHGTFALAVPYLPPNNNNTQAKGGQTPRRVSGFKAAGGGKGSGDQLPRRSSYGGPETVRENDNKPLGGGDPLSPAFEAIPSSPVPSDSNPLAGPSCHVFVFDPSSRDPMYHCYVPRATSATVLYVDPSLPQHAQVEMGPSWKSCPMLIVTDDRSYSYTSAPDQSQSAAASAALPVDTSSEEKYSAFNAAFGKLSTTTAQGASNMDVDGEEGAVGHGAKKERLRMLFDGPSHALPTPSNLASAFLRLLTTSAAPPASD